MKKILLFMLSLLVAVGVSAEKRHMDFSQMTNGWGTSFEPSTKTITFQDTWKGHGWWLGSYDAEKYTHFVVELSEAATIDINVVVVYTEKEGDNNKNTTVSVAKGSTQGTVALDETLKHGIQQIYIGNTEETGSVTLLDAYFYREGPQFSSTKDAVSCEGIGTADATIDVSSLTTYPDNAVFAIVGTIDVHDHVGWGMGKIRDKSYGELKSLGSWSSDETVAIMTVEELRSYAQDGKIYIQIWNGTLKEVYVLLNTNTITITLTSVGIGSMILPFDAEVPTGMKVYTTDQYLNGIVTMKEVHTIEANTPYIIQGKPGQYPFLGKAQAESFQYQVGYLCGTYEEMLAPASSYVLQNGDEGAGFYLVAEGEEPVVKPFRAYMTELPSGAQTKRLTLDFGGLTTGVETIEAAPMASPLMYDLMGQRIQRAAKGMYIQEGRVRICK